MLCLSQLCNPSNMRWIAYFMKEGITMTPPIVPMSLILISRFHVKHWKPKFRRTPAEKHATEASCGWSVKMFRSLKFASQNRSIYRNMLRRKPSIHKSQGYSEVSIILQLLFSDLQLLTGLCRIEVSCNLQSVSRSVHTSASTHSSQSS